MTTLMQPCNNTSFSNLMRVISFEVRAAFVKFAGVLLGAVNAAECASFTTGGMLMT